MSEPLSPGRYFHVSRSENRGSIEQFGLDWNRMGAVPGIAGSRAPEMDAVFVCDEFSVDFFCRFSETPVDVWLVDAGGLEVEDAPDGWWILRTPIGPDRLRLVEAARPGTPWPAEWDADPTQSG